MHESPAIEIERWQRLLVWLRGHGMDVSKKKFRVERKPSDAGFGLFATESCPASEPLFTIPATALMNVRTLTVHYPNSDTDLTATQLIALHLSLSRPKGDEDSEDVLFGPFISILPREFDSHPLTWVVKGMLEPKGAFPLLDLLPPAVTSSLVALRSRFLEDWDAVSKYMVHVPPLLTKREAFVNFLWAWLNVNTRCIYYRLKPFQSDPANVALCPVLDFANHSWKASDITPLSGAGIWNTVRPASHCGDFCFHAARIVPIQSGEEIYLTYGGHSNRTLFVEYGFVNPVLQESIRNGEYPAEADAQQVIEKLFRSRGVVGTWMKKVLESEGYWGDWTLHSSPPPAYPSFRVTTALRLYAMFYESKTIPESGEDILNPWRNTLLGITDQITGENEHGWKSILQQVCRRLIEEGCRGRTGVAGAELGVDKEWIERVRSNIKTLWDEQIIVADAVLTSIKDGVEF